VHEVFKGVNIGHSVGGVENLGDLFKGQLEHCLDPVGVLMLGDARDYLEAAAVSG